MKKYQFKNLFSFAAATVLPGKEFERYVADKLEPIIQQLGGELIRQFDTDRDIKQGVDIDIFLPGGVTFAVDICRGYRDKEFRYHGRRGTTALLDLAMIRSTIRGDGDVVAMLRRSEAFWDQYCQIMDRRSSGGWYV